jgi:hypothetical protein
VNSIFLFGSPHVVCAKEKDKNDLVEVNALRNVRIGFALDVAERSIYEVMALLKLIKESVACH